MAGLDAFFKSGTSFTQWPLSNSTYKAEKEAWVTGYTGSSVSTVFLLASIFPTLVLFNSVLLSFLLVTLPNYKIVQRLVEIQKNNFSFALRLLFEFCTIVLPSLFAMTTSIDKLWRFGLPCEVLAIAVTFALHCISSHFYNVKLFAISTPPNLAGLLIRQPTFISQYRSYMMLSTIIAILAVDFSIFPREHAKSETYGLSLMDMGVGAVIFASALVSRQTRLHVESKTMTQEEFSMASQRHLRSALSSVAPLIILGSVRIIAHKLIGYQLHESEYGLHWNFFFTVAAVTLLSSILQHLFGGGGGGTQKVTKKGFQFFPPILSRNYLLGVFFILTFFPLPLLQSFLFRFVDVKGSTPVTHHGFGPDSYCSRLSSINNFPDYILCASRIDVSSSSSSSINQSALSVGRKLFNLILQNREGIFGLQGFFSLYLIGLYFGSWIFEFITEDGGFTVRNYLSRGSDSDLWVISFFAFASWLYLAINSGSLEDKKNKRFIYFPPPSRRLVDVQYCGCVIAFNLFILALLFNINIRTLRPPPTPQADIQQQQLQLQPISNVNTTAVRRRGASKVRRGRSASPWRSPSPVMSRQRKPLSTTSAARSEASRISLLPFSEDILYGGSILLESFNSNFLFLFFFANLLTGIANVTLYTVYSSSLVAYSVLTLYLITICIVAVTASVFKVNFKVW